jgi:hypothetical protein
MAQPNKIQHLLKVNLGFFLFILTTGANFWICNVEFIFVFIIMLNLLTMLLDVLI